MSFSSLYLHVPFCRSHCIYCDFFVVLEKRGGSTEGQDAFVDAVLREIHGRFHALQENPESLKTLYIGGGTPSLLPARHYQTIFQAIQTYAPFAPDIEITMEANPGDGASSDLADPPEAYREVGINRISVGVQSLNDTELKKLSRRHSAEEAKRFIQILKAGGFENIAVDLMYGLPGQTPESWQKTLAGAVSLDVPHVSMYGLQVEKNTPLKRLVAMGAYPLPDETATVAMYFEGLHFLEAHGLVRYEFSNLARPGFESRHNLTYWNNEAYLALGPGAHGYVAGERYENIRNLARYLENPLAATLTACPKNEQLENALIFGLRKREGVDISVLEEHFQFNFSERYGMKLLKYIDAGWVDWANNRLRITEAGIPTSNTILAEFIEML